MNLPVLLVHVVQEPAAFLGSSGGFGKRLCGGDGGLLEVGHGRDCRVDLGADFAQSPLGGFRCLSRQRERCPFALQRGRAACSVQPGRIGDERRLRAGVALLVCPEGGGFRVERVCAASPVEFGAQSRDVSPGGGGARLQFHALFVERAAVALLFDQTPRAAGYGALPFRLSVGFDLDGVDGSADARKKKRVRHLFEDFGPLVLVGLEKLVEAALRKHCNASELLVGETEALLDCRTPLRRPVGFADRFRDARIRCDRLVLQNEPH